MSEEKQNNLKLSRKFLTQFLELYKESPCLWDRQDPDYKKKKIRNEAIGRLTQLVNNYDPKATRVHVLRKIESLRSCVRREYHKVQFSIRNNLLYEPNLWYYHLLSFVFDDRDGKKSESETATEEEEENSEMITNDRYDEPAIIYPNYTADSLDEARSPTPQSSYDAKRYNDAIDQYDAIGINVAAKLRALPANARILAEKLINDVLYQAQMNCLTSNTVLSISDPIKSENIM